MSMRAAAALMVLVLVAPLVAGCARPQPVDEIGATIAALANGGVPVMEDVNSRTPIVAPSGAPSAMRLTRWQVRNLLIEADAGGGYRADDLDGFAPKPSDGPAFSALLDAWLTRGQGALAAYALTLMPARVAGDAKPALFPSLVVLAFIGDIARPAQHASLPYIDFERFIAAPADADGICSDVSEWVSSLVNSLTSAIGTSGGVLSSLLGSIVSVVGAVTGTILATVVRYVTRIAIVAGTLMQIASMFKPWKVTLKPDPTTVTLEGDPQDGTFTATLDADPINWPSSLKDCVSTLTSGAVDLNDAAYKDAPITWTATSGIPTIATNTQKDDTLKDDKTAAYSFRTMTSPKPPDDMCPRLVPDGTIGVGVTVARHDIDKVVSSLEGLILNEMPSLLAGYVKPFVQPAIAAGSDKLSGQFTSPTASAGVAVSQYVEDPLCEHTPPPTSSPEATTTPHQTGALPPGPCEGLVTTADVAQSFGGKDQLIPMTTEMKAAFSGMWSVVDKTAHSNSQINPSIENASMCPIGVLTGADINGVPDGDMHGIFVVITPVQVFKGTAQDPQCRSQMGAAVDALGAECFAGPASVIVTDNHMEYEAVSMTSPTAQYALMGAVMHRLSGR